MWLEYCIENMREKKKSLDACRCPMSKQGGRDVACQGNENGQSMTHNVTRSETNESRVYANASKVEP